MRLSLLFGGARRVERALAVFTKIDTELEVAIAECNDKSLRMYDAIDALRESLAEEVVAIEKAVAVRNALKVFLVPGGNQK